MRKIRAVVIFGMACGIGGIMMQLNSKNNNPDAKTNVPADVVLDRAIKVIYSNWRGEKATRTIVPLSLYWGKSEWHPQEQWMIRVWDVDRNDYREYAFKDIEKHTD